jgi:hypothetical protein
MAEEQEKGLKKEAAIDQRTNRLTAVCSNLSVKSRMMRQTGDHSNR